MLKCLPCRFLEETRIFGNDGIIFMKRNNLFDYLKFVLIVFVIVTHIEWGDATRQIFVFPFVIEMAVPLFLVISSFLRFKKYEANNYKSPFLHPKNYLKSCIDILLPYLIIVFVEIALYCLAYFSKVSNSRFI